MFWFGWVKKLGCQGCENGCWGAGKNTFQLVGPEKELVPVNNEPNTLTGCWFGSESFGISASFGASNDYRQASMFKFPKAGNDNFQNELVGCDNPKDGTVYPSFLKVKLKGFSDPFFF